MSHARLALAAAALLCVCAAPAPAKVPTGPAGKNFYNPPKSKLHGAHGSIIWARRLHGNHGSHLPTGATSYLVLYRSKAPSGATVPTSGVISIPDGAAPSGGFPVVSWAHGTTGIADVCAPSLKADTPVSNDYDRDLQSEMSDWVKDRYAVAQTDYQGLGTPGMHPYLIGVSEGRSVIDAALAARSLSKNVGTKWVAIGHSQGGHATLWAAALGNGYAPSMHMLGAAPLAPATHIGEQAKLISQIDGNPFGGLPGLIIAGAMQDAHIQPHTALSAKALKLYPQIDKVCDDKLSQQDSWGGLALKDIFKDGYDTTPLIDEISKNDPEDLTIKIPLLIAQGKADTTVIPSFTDQTVQDLEGRGTTITYDTYDGVNHTGVVAASHKDADTFIEGLLGVG
jgi:pimeloyl-ACP methyl ester carboxylesterase